MSATNSTDCNVARAEYMSVSDLSNYTGIAASTWNKRRVTGDTPPYSKIGRMVRYRRIDVDLWFAKRSANSTSETNS